MNTPSAIVIGAGLLLAIGTSADARRSRDLFPPRATTEGRPLFLQGVGVLRVKGLIPVYDAALYLPEGIAPGEALGPVPKRLEVVYRVGAEARRFAEAGDRILTASLSRDRLAGIQERLDQINRLYPDPRKGDRCSLTYVPGRGTELRFNGESLGWIPGDDFAELYFSIWLGRQPASASLRDALLGRSRGS